MGELRPPFEPGNTLSLSHGADSPRMVQPLADRLAAELAAAAPWCAHSAFAAEVAAWAWEEARVRLLQAWVNEHGLLDEDSQGALSQLERAQGRAARLRGNLGLNPAAWAKVLATLTRANDGQADDEVAALLAVAREIEGRRSVGPGCDDDREVDR